MSGRIWREIGSGRLVSIVDRGSATLALTFSTCDHWRVRRLYKTGLPLSPLGMIDWSRVFWPRITATASERIPRSRRRSSSFDAMPSASHWTLDLLLRNKKRKKERSQNGSMQLLLLLLLFRRRKLQIASLLRWIIYLFQHLFESVLHRNIFSCNYIKYERRGERLFEGYYSTVLAIKSDRVLKIEKSNGIFNW